MQEILDFLRELSANNDRVWFAANKPRYDVIRTEVNRLTQAMLDTLSAIDTRASMLTPADCTYRIYRDTRFSADKTPYKTHIGVFMNPPRGKKSYTMGHYLHMEPDNVFFAAGTVCLPSPILKAVRRAVYDNIEEYMSIVDDNAFRELFPKVGENLLKTSPQGFPRDWEYMEYIRPRDFVASSAPLPVVGLKEVPAMLRPYMEQAHRFNSFHNYTIEDME